MQPNLIENMQNNTNSKGCAHVMSSQVLLQVICHLVEQERKKKDKENAASVLTQESCRIRDLVTGSENQTSPLP